MRKVSIAYESKAELRPEFLNGTRDPKQRERERERHTHTHTQTDTNTHSHTHTKFFEVRTEVRWTY